MHARPPPTRLPEGFSASSVARTYTFTYRILSPASQLRGDTGNPRKTCVCFHMEFNITTNNFTTMKNGRHL